MNENERQPDGRFQKGHPYLPARDGVKVGRKPTLARQVKDALSIAEDAMPEIIAAMIRRATDPDVPLHVQQQASEFLIERIYGKANQPISSKGDPIATFVFQLPSGRAVTARQMLEQSGGATQVALPPERR